MKVLIRTDASTAIGSGHAVRTHTLARALRSAGYQVCFACVDSPGNHIGALQEDRFDVLVLPEELRPRTQAGTDVEAAASQTRDAQKIAGEMTAAWDWVVVDHYRLGAPWETAMRKVTENILVIDDLADRQHNCDMLLDQNYEQATERYQNFVPAHCRLLLGPKYALLKQEYQSTREGLAPRLGPPERLLIYFGGSDRWNMTTHTLEILHDTDLRHIGLDVVLSSQSVQIDRVKQLCTTHGRATLHHDLPHLAYLMARCDAAIGSVGSTAWERICLGLPTLAITVAENEEPLATYLHLHELIRWCGRDTDINADAFANGIRQLARSDLRKWSERCLAVCDGRGVDRVVQVMQSMKHEGSDAAI